MPGLSIHVVDVSRGVVAGGMRVEVFAASPQRRAVAAGTLNSKGQLDDPALSAEFSPGRYEAVLHVADYYHAEGIALPSVPFLGVVHYEFGIANTDQHYHLPFKVTPWGYSCFRGGA